MEIQTKSNFYEERFGGKVTSPDVTKADLVDIGTTFWPHSYKDAKSDDDINDNIDRYLLGVALQNPRKAEFFTEALKLPDQNIMVLGAARWVDQGLPVIRLGHKRAAAFMATSISKEVADVIRPPFHAFYIELPDGLIAIRDAEDVDIKAVGVLVHAMQLPRDVVRPNGVVMHTGLRWRWVAITNSHLVQWQLNRQIEEIAGLADQGNDWDDTGLPIGEYDLRVSALIGRLICSVCLMMSNPSDLKERLEPASRSKSGKRPAPGAPRYRVFIEGKPISVDVRPAISAYLRGERNSPDVRLLVRGHWKMQAHGKGLTLRKEIHIEPYWRGGADGDPILTRIYATEKDGEHREKTEGVGRDTQ